MAERQPSGARIRDRRQERGLRQAELAARVGISPSYLNLIEHGRRRIAGKLLQDIARALDIDPVALSESPDIPTLQALRVAVLHADGGSRPPPEVDRVQDLADRFPGWAALIVQQDHLIAALRTRVAELASRVSHDPALAQALHRVISGVTAVRSSANILTETADIDRDWQERFLRNISAESELLANASRDLASVLETPGPASLEPSAPEVAEQWLDARDHHLTELEAGRPLADLPDGDVGARLLAWAARYAADAAALPMAAFLPAAVEAGFDPQRLATRFQAPFARVLRRLASLPPGSPPMGLMIADASGTLTRMKALTGMPSVQTGACPLWPLFEALAMPGRALRAVAALPGEGAPRFLCYAVASPVDDLGWEDPPRLELTMLLIPQPPRAAPGDRLVGPTCRLCPRVACPARREPSIFD